jgi:hypothetical protein
MRNVMTTADRVDYWIRRHAISHPVQDAHKVNSARDRGVALTAIGKCLKDEYDAVMNPIPPHLAVLVEQLQHR